jgi:hypothetical protein
VVVISACATGFVNAFAHRERLGWVGASLLAILITGFVEKFYFALPSVPISLETLSSNSLMSRVKEIFNVSRLVIIIEARESITSKG